MFSLFMCDKSKTQEVSVIFVRVSKFVDIFLIASWSTEVVNSGGYKGCFYDKSLIQI